MALFPQFPYSNLHELNLDWLIEQISQLMENGTVISVNGMSGIVTLYTEKDVVFPDRAFDPDWSVYRRIAEKHAGLKFTGEKFYYITKNVDDEDFTVQEVFTSSNLPPFPVTSVNGQTGEVIISIPVTSVNGNTGAVVLAGDNLPYNIDGSYTIEDVIIPLEESIGHVIRYNKCSEGVTAGQYVYLIMSGISGRSDGLYRAVNNVSANTPWTSADLQAVSGGLGAEVGALNSKIKRYEIGVQSSESDLKTALLSLSSSMADGEVQNISFLVTTSNDNFDAYSVYNGWLFKQSGEIIKVHAINIAGNDIQMAVENNVWSVKSNSKACASLNSKLTWEYANQTSTLNEVKTVPGHSALLLRCLFSDGGIITQELIGDGFFVFNEGDTSVSVNYSQPNATYQISSITGSLTCTVSLYIKH